MCLKILEYEVCISLKTFYSHSLYFEVILILKYKEEVKRSNDFRPLVYAIDFSYNGPLFNRRNSGLTLLCGVCALPASMTSPPLVLKCESPERVILLALVHRNVIKLFTKKQKRSIVKTTKFFHFGKNFALILTK